MLTFEQFYREFLAEAKYLPGVAGGPIIHHDPNAYYYIRANGENYTYELANNRTDDVVGTIVPKPLPLSYAHNLKRLPIIAALGVQEEQQSAKIYAFHIAKYKLEHPGARENNAEDMHFYAKTLQDTAALLTDFINKNGGNEQVSVVYPYSTNTFNEEVCEIADVQPRIVEKYTFEEAAQQFWSSDDPTRKAIKDFSLDNNGKLFIYGILRYISHALANNIEILNLRGNDHVSLDKLASRIAYISNNENQLNNAHNYLFDNAFTTNERLRLRIIANVNNRLNIVQAANQIQNNDQREREISRISSKKSYFLEDLNAIYFKQLPQDAELHDIIAVVDDNINSATTYNAVRAKLPAQARVTWVVGIVPLEHVAPTPNERATAQQAAEQEKLAEKAEEIKNLKEKDIQEIKKLALGRSYRSFKKFDKKEDINAYSNMVLNDKQLNRLNISSNITGSPIRGFNITFTNNPIKR